MRALPLRTVTEKTAPAQPSIAELGKAGSTVILFGQHASAQSQGRAKACTIGPVRRCLGKTVDHVAPQSPRHTVRPRPAPRRANSARRPRGRGEAPGRVLERFPYTPAPWAMSDAALHTDDISAGCTGLRWAARRRLRDKEARCRLFLAEAARV